MKRPAAIAVGSAISLLALVVLSAVAVVLIVASLFFVPTSGGPTLWLLPLALVVGGLGPIVALLGVHLTSRWSDWRGGLTVSIICQVVLVGVPTALGMTVWREAGEALPWLLGVPFVGAGVFGVFASMAMLHAGRSSVGLRGGGERTRQVMVAARSRTDQSLSPLPGCAAAAARLVVAPRLWAAVLPALALPIMAAIAMAGYSATLLIVVISTFSLIVQPAVVARTAEVSYGGLLPADMHDLVSLGERRGAVMERNNAIRVVVLLAGALAGLLVAAVVAVVAASQSVMEFAILSGIAAVLCAVILVVGVRRAAVARRAPAEWLRTHVAAEWTPTGSIREVKRALAEASSALGLPYPPGLQLVAGADVNMWVVGDRQHAVVGITEGILEVMGTEEMRAAFASLLARVVVGGVATPAAAAVSDLTFGGGPPLGGALGYVQAADIHGALALRDVNAVERALMCALGHGTRIPGMSGAFASHLWVWPRAADEVPESELERIELLRAVDPARMTLLPEHSIRPRISPGLRTQEGTPCAWVVCSGCGKENTVIADRCASCAAGL